MTKNLILYLHAVGKQRKDIASYVGCNKASVSSAINALKAGQHVRNRRRPPHKMTDSFAGLPRPTGSRQPPNSPKSGVVLWGGKSLLQPPFVVSRWASVAANLQQNPCLTKHKLKRLQWANMHKDCTKMSKVIFSDESKLCIEFGDRGALVWRTKDERYNLACLKRYAKFPTSVMVWGCVSTRYGQYCLPQINSYLYIMLCIWKC